MEAILQNNFVTGKRALFVILNLGIILSWAVQLAEKGKDRAREETMIEILWWDEQIEHLESMLWELEVSHSTHTSSPDVVYAEKARWICRKYSDLTVTNPTRSHVLESIILTARIGERAPRADPMGTSTKPQTCRIRKRRRFATRSPQRPGKRIQKEEPFTNYKGGFGFLQTVCYLEEAGT